MPDLKTLYHTTHSCGHQAYWSNEIAAEATTPWPCPWCGGEAMPKQPYSIVFFSNIPGIDRDVSCAPSPDVGDKANEKAVR